ncbi:hypothetical protein [Arcanobacterium pinnipediorum]|uniref:Uncharacterized protein n=1 Tax=Arcanobacterium pinnipediorum TaxID=1503041 RepID=A0ABY5AJG1_9ACTO|nr:hypothetical protein [Arcanobacterium pinnipediorum]USR80106.1 hypothetical protein NG665_03795 [Arcanobacterium pinnipediorum]
MAREDNDLGNLSNWDADAEWKDFISIDQPRPYADPRNWTPSEDDEEFDPRNLPPATPVASGSFPQLAAGLWSLCAVFIAVFIAGFYGVIVLEEYLWILAAVAGLGCAVGAVILHSPPNSDDNDDGARL